MKKILYVNWGTPDKEYTFRAGREKGLAIYLATSQNYPKWVRKYVSRERLIITNTFDSDILTADVAKFMKVTGVEFDAVTTFFEMNIVQTADLAAAIKKQFLEAGVARCSSANKLLMRLTCEKNNIPTPKYLPFSSLKEGLTALDSFQSPVVIKAVHSGHSYGVMKVEGQTKKEFRNDFEMKYREARCHLDANFDEWMQYCGLIKDHFILEEWIEGPVFSVDGLIQNGVIIFSEVTEYEITSGPYLLQRSTLIPSRFDFQARQQYKAAALRIIQALAFDNCGFHIEMKLSNNGPVLLEAAARLPGGKILDTFKYVYHVDLAKMFLDICLGNRLEPLSTIDPTYKVLIEAKYTELEGLVTRAVVGPRKINVAGFNLFSYVKLGQFIRQIAGFPTMYLYYKLSGRAWREIEIKRNKIMEKFEITVERNWVYYLLRFHGIFSRLIPSGVRGLVIGRGLLKPLLRIGLKSR